MSPDPAKNRLTDEQITKLCEAGVLQEGVADPYYGARLPKKTGLSPWEKLSAVSIVALAALILSNLPKNPDRSQPQAEPPRREKVIEPGEKANPGIQAAEIRRAEVLTVKEGDTLSELAYEILGNGTDEVCERIAADPRNNIKDIHLVRPGQQVVIDPRVLLVP